jgi:thiamine biosynthesis lipoprotein
MTYAACVIPRLAPAVSWTLVSAGSGAVAAAERDALGTRVRVVTWPPSRLRAALGAVDREVRRLDLAASRFRDDSELIAVQARASAGPVGVSTSLAEVVRVALAAAEWTGGLVDPTVGRALIALGYDRDFAAVPAWLGSAPVSCPVPGWRSVRLEDSQLTLPAGTVLDFGATAKGLGADWAAAAFPGPGGVLVSLGGDLAVGGEPPEGGWPVRVADGAQAGAGQVVRLTHGGIATSSVTCRRWHRADRTLHHIIDPRTGWPAEGPWRTASVAGATGAEANAAATAAIVAGAGAAGWLGAHGLPARLTGHDGVVFRVGGWPEEGGLVPVPEGVFS